MSIDLKPWTPARLRRQLARDTRHAVRDMRQTKKIRKTRPNFYIDCANGYDGILIDRKSVTVIDASKGIVQMKVLDIVGA